MTARCVLRRNILLTAAGPDWENDLTAGKKLGNFRAVYTCGAVFRGINYLEGLWFLIESEPNSSVGNKIDAAPFNTVLVPEFIFCAGSNVYFDIGCG